MFSALLTLVVFVAAALAVAGVYSLIMDLFLRDRVRVSQRLDDEFRKQQRSQVRKSQLFKDLGKAAAEAANDKEFRANLWRRFCSWVEQSGVAIDAKQLLGIAAGIGVLLGALAFILSRLPLLGGGVTLVGAATPFFYIRFKRQKRLDKILSQLPDTFDLIGRLIRAGKTIAQALQGVGEEFPPPIGNEFAHCYEQQNLGLAPELALRELAQRVGLVEIKIFVLAILVQRQTGGNLADLIENLATTVRERFRIRGKIKVLTAEGRMEAAVLLALPPVVFCMILFLNHNYGMLLLEHPNLIVGMLGLMLAGLLWIRRIINFDF